MPQDIRDKPAIRHEDVVGLNFIRTEAPFVFRRHFRHGLRSHIMEILKSADVEAENAGTVVAGNRRFPRARPTHMLRIFRTRLQTLESALAEIERVKAVTAYLGSDFIARSSEFLVDYHGPEGTAIMLCGFQRYIEGEMLDPWSLLDGSRLLPSLYANLYAPPERSDDHRRAWIEATRMEGARFIEAVKRMIAEVGHIPDLAGAGNLIVTRDGRIRLVDINNITPVIFDDQIHLDDKGYPVCDKSIEALSLMEQKVIGRPADTGEALYRFFLESKRRRQVRRQEQAFYRGNVL